MLQITNCAAAQPGPGQTELTLKTHIHKVTITNTETGVSYEELSGAAEPMPGETETSFERHRHSTTAGYLEAPQ